MTFGYSHGWQECRLCYTGAHSISLPNNWMLHNNPGYAGSSNPSTLILGFSKGANQNEIAIQGAYDQVPFAGMRDRLQQLLVALDLMPTDRRIDQMLTAHEVEFGAASLVRCSLCRKKGVHYVTSGGLVTEGFRVPEIKAIIERCAVTFLSRPPESLRRVILLGTNRIYIQKTKELFRHLFPDYKCINEVAFQARGVLWVYAAHPSKANGRFKAWLAAEPGNLSGQKYIQARQALTAYR